MVTASDNDCMDRAQQELLAGDGRKYGRYAWRTDVQICWTTVGLTCTPLWVRATDISSGGCGFLCKNMVHARTRGVVLLQPPGKEPTLRPFEVIHCRYHTELKAHHVGVRWIPEPLEKPPVEIKTTAEGAVMVPT